MSHVLTKTLAGLLSLALVGAFITCVSICSEHQQAMSHASVGQGIEAVSDPGCEQECELESIPAVLPNKPTITSIPTAAQTHVFVSLRLNGSSIGQPSKEIPSIFFTYDPPVERLCVFRI